MDQLYYLIDDNTVISERTLQHLRRLLRRESPQDQTADQFHDGDLIDRQHATMFVQGGKLVRSYVDERGLRITEPVN